MTGSLRSRTAQVAALSALVALLVASAAAGAPAGTAGRPAGRLHRAVLDLYALDSRLSTARAEVASLEAAAAKLRRERASLRSELAAARSTLASSQRRLGVRLRVLYEQGSLDPLAVMFGTSSLGRGLREVDALQTIAAQSSRIVAATRAARARLLHDRRTFALDARRLARSLAGARAAEHGIAAAAAARGSYIASLRRQAQPERVSGIVQTARAAVERSQKLQPPTPPVHQPSGGRKLVVRATCYILRGRTATGMRTQPGVVAVDPNVIPLGSKLYVPGYGKGVAADVGGGIKGAIIDLWYSTYAECASWGNRTVTITIY